MADAKKNIAAYYDAWKSNSVDVFDKVLTDDFVDHNPPPGFSPDREGNKQFAAFVMGASKDIEMTISPIVVDGDHAAVHWSMDWTQVGDFMGMVPADGKRLHLRGHDFYTLRDGLLAEVWHVEDLAGVMMQLGVMPQP
jgi:steroid delta-isomerase-like uncharacterized protein